MSLLLNMLSVAKLLQSCPTLCDPIDSSPLGSSLSLGFSRQEHWSGLPFPSPNMLSRLDITLLPRSTRLLISWLQSPSAVILEPKKIKCDTISTVYPSISHEVMGLDAMNQAWRPINLNFCQDISLRHTSLKKQKSFKLGEISKNYRLVALTSWLKMEYSRFLWQIENTFCFFFIENIFKNCFNSSSNIEIIFTAIKQIKGDR